MGMTRAFHAGSLDHSADSESPAIAGNPHGVGDTPRPHFAHSAHETPANGGRGEAHAPRSSNGQDTRLSREQSEFDSPSGYSEKKCYACGESKPLGDFYADKSRPDGRTKKCGPCMREYSRQYRRKNNTAPNGPDYLVDAATGCWVWQKYIAPDGYGEMRFESRAWAAHRWFYTQHVGEIPEDTLHHECANKLCVNPAHLTPMSYSDHARLEWQIRRGVAA